MITRFIARILANSLAIALAAYFVPDFNFPLNDWQALLIAGVILAIFNSFLKPILKFISAPFTLITMGTFPVVINIGLLWLVQVFLPDLKINGFWAYFWGMILISVINYLFDTLSHKKPAEAEA